MVHERPRQPGFNPHRAFHFSKHAPGVDSSLSSIVKTCARIARFAYRSKKLGGNGRARCYTFFGYRRESQFRAGFAIPVRCAC